MFKRAQRSGDINKEWNKTPDDARSTLKNARRQFKKWLEQVEAQLVVKPKAAPAKTPSEAAPKAAANAVDGPTPATVRQPPLANKTRRTSHQVDVTEANKHRQLGADGAAGGVGGEEGQGKGGERKGGRCRPAAADCRREPQHARGPPRGPGLELIAN